MVPAAAVLMAITGLLKLLLLSGTTAAIVGYRYTEQLQVLSHVVSGPARGRPLALHLDSALPADMQQAVLGVEAVRKTPHLTLSLSLNHSFGWPRQEASTSALSYASSSMLHVVLWLTPRPELLQALWLYWKPRNLLFLSLGSSSGADILRDEALSGVENLALIGQLSAEADPSRDALGVYTVMPFSFDGVQLLSPWRQASFSSWEALFPDRFPSFEGYTFHIASRMRDLIFFYPSERDPLKGEGVCEDMLQVLSAKLNFTYTTTTDSSDSKWGILSNGSWDGLMGMLERREKNFTINSLLVNFDRSNSFDFSTTIDIDGFGAYLRTPLPLPQWTSITRVFEGPIWLAVFMAFVAVSCFTLLQVRRVPMTNNISTLIKINNINYFLQLFFFMQERASHGSVQSLTQNRPVRGVATICLDTQRPLLSQSVPLLPPTLSLRTLMALWFVHCLVITVAYTSNLVGIFTRPAYPRRLRDLQDIAENGYRSCSGFNAYIVILLFHNNGRIDDQRKVQRVDLSFLQAEHGEFRHRYACGTEGDSRPLLEDSEAKTGSLS